MTESLEAELRQFRAFLRASERLVKAEGLADKLTVIAEGIVEAGVFRRCVVTAHLRHRLRGGDVISAAGLDDASLRQMRTAPPVSSTQYARICRLGTSLGNNLYYIPAAILDRYYANHRMFVRSQLPVTAFVNWHPDDMFAAMLVSQNGTHCGTLTADDPPSGRVPTEDSVRVLSLFASVAAEVLERDLTMRVDALTGLYNGRFLSETLRQLDQAAEPFSAMFADLDNLKPVNDRFGHKVGDMFLNAAAQAVRRSMPARAMAFRPYGDEFVVLGLGSEAAMRRAAARLEHALGVWNRTRRLKVVNLGPEEREAPAYQLACSAGVAARHDGRRPAQQVVAEAEVMMYAAKSRHPAYGRRAAYPSAGMAPA